VEAGEDLEEDNIKMQDIFTQGKKATIKAALATVFFAIAKAVVGIISGSVVLLADAVHSAADSFSTFAAWFGLKIAQKKPSDKFPYGFYKAENITAFLISLLILFAGYNIVKESYQKIFTEYELGVPLIAISVAILDAIVMFIVGTYEMKVGKKINSQSLVADGRESRLHIFSSSIVLVGLVSKIIGISYLEGIMGIVLSLFIFQVGIESLRDSIFALMDVSPSKEVEKKVESILDKVSGLRGFENLRLRKSGPFVFGEVKAKIGKSIDMKRAYEISNKIEKDIKEKIEVVDYFTVSLEPFETGKKKICIPLKEGKDLKAEISDHFGRAERFIFIETDNKKVENFYTKENPHKREDVRAGLKASLFVVEDKVDSIVTKEMGPVSLHTLRDNIVDVYLAEDGTVQNSLDLLFENKLKLLKEATRDKT
jgi:cation diffusion facilitator family transporter